MTAYPKQIVFVHLLNDYSGSPLVLSQVIEALPEGDYMKCLYTSTSSREGFLSGLEGVRTVHFRYRWKANGWLRLLTYTGSQILLFAQLLRYYRKDVLIYINTLLPFGAALAGRLMGKKIIYHLHETSMKPPPLKAFLRFVANHTADSVIYVSDYLASAEKLSKPAPVVIHNCLPPAFTETAARFRERNTSTQTPTGIHHPSAPAGPPLVLMLCSMKEYKGIAEFHRLAGMLPDLAFELVLNATAQETQTWLARQKPTPNLTVHAAQSNTHPFYQRATIVINLSHPDKWVETFGMTILEAMSYGLPVIVPPAGGVRELVAEGVNGFLADYRELPTIAEHIRRLTADPALYQQLSDQALLRAGTFSAAVFGSSVRRLVTTMLPKKPAMHFTTSPNPVNYE
jgi:glycosyltransferase involved in cell wall biosynthesis